MSCGAGEVTERLENEQSSEDSFIRICQESATNKMGNTSYISIEDRR